MGFCGLSDKLVELGGVESFLKKFVRNCQAKNPAAAVGVYPRCSAFQS
jgi:hypothetical protein